MAAVMASDAPAPGGAYVTIAEAGELAGLQTQGVYKAVYRGRLHPLRVKGERGKVVFRSELLAWRNRYRWQPTPVELQALVASGYQAEDFIPSLPGEPRGSSTASQGASSMGGASDMSGAFVSPADVLAYIQVLSQSATTGAASVGGEVAERMVRPFAEALRDGATVDVGAVTRAAGDMAAQAVRPFAESLNESIAPLTQAMAQAALPRPTPPTEDATEDAIARRMQALRVELAQLLTRMLDAIRPMAERLLSGGYITPEDAAPMITLMAEIAGGLADTPLYDLAPRDISAQLPAIVEHMANKARAGSAASVSPTPEK